MPELVDFTDVAQNQTSSTASNEGSQLYLSERWPHRPRPGVDDALVQHHLSLYLSRQHGRMDLADDRPSRGDAPSLLITWHPGIVCAGPGPFQQWGDP